MSTEAIHMPTVASARDHLREVLDAAQDGRPATIRRGRGRSAVVDAVRLRRSLELLVDAAPTMVFEAGEWAMFFPGLPIGATGSTPDAALDDAVSALREYATDWSDHLRTAPNHEQNWGLVQLVELSSDDELRAWLTAER